jgi:eukaryotic-like serine/threonine-protein kinase
MHIPHNPAPFPLPDLPSPLAAALRDRYTLERELGRGGMATVFLAQDLKHKRPVALKVLRPELAASLGAERFQREIEIAARLQHPHILTVLDSGEAAGQLWFTMPFVEGESLRERLRRERQLSVEDALRVAREAAQALQYAHEHGVVHRDIKPENLLLTKDGSTLVADFGIARALGADEHLTQTGMSIGTPAYMSPEQASGDKALDTRADIYSLGAVLYEMLTGEPPYTGPTAQVIILKRFSEPVPSVRKVRPGVPESVDQATRRALAPLAADRFATAAEFGRALRPTAADATGAPTVVTMPADPAAPVLRSGARARRRLLPVGLATLGIGFLLGLGLLFAWRHSRRDGDAPGPKRLAVLPFENQGDSADAYFADGITDELRGKLAAVTGLEVIASRSSNDYRRTTKSLPEIGRDLGVNYLLIGKIWWQKRAGGAGRVRVSPELIRVVTGTAPTTKWAQAFDAPLTDVFQVQADIAGRIAKALDVALGAGVPQALAARPTTSPEAYDDYLRANEYYNRQTIPDVQLAARLYRQALVLDSTFALAWARLARAGAFLYWFKGDPSAEQLTRVEQAARRALALAPELPEAHVAMGYYHYWGRRDYTRALEEFSLAGQRDPNNAEVAYVAGAVLRRQGKWDQALASFKRAAELDPRSYSDLDELGVTYTLMRAYPEAERALDRATTLGPDLPAAWGDRALLYLNWKGNPEAPRRLLGQALSRMDFGRLVGRVPYDFSLIFSLIAADPAYRQEVARLTPAPFGGDTLRYLAFKASVYRYWGQRATARVYEDSTRTEALALIARHEDDVFTHATLAIADAYLGRDKEAVDAGQRAVAILPLSQDAVAGQAGPLALAEVYTVLGDTSAALDQLQALLAVPSYLSAGRLRADPVWAPLRGNPRFERLAAGN